MHVYAPEQKEYIPIRLTLNVEEESLRVHQAKFPRPEKYFFAPLKETQLVFSKPFRIVQPVTIGTTTTLRDAARAGKPLTITGTLRYQACDDAICYVPRELPVSWTVTLRP
jgi:hypothetical protein